MLGKMWSERIRFLVTISCVLAVPVASQYGGNDDSGQFGNNQGNFGGNNQFPQNQQANSLPQYGGNSGEQGFPQPQQPPQNQFQPQGQGGSGPQNDKPWWQGQNAFTQPPGHPGVEMLAPPGQQPAQPQQPSFNNPYGNSAPSAPAPQQPYNPPSAPPPVPQEPNYPQNNNPYPNPTQPSAPSGPGWNAPPPQQQNYNPSGQGFPPSAPPQNYQPPPQFQQPQQPYTPPTQPPYQPPVAQPNLGYQPPPQQAQEADAAPYPGCPAAMKCVQDEYCNAIGVMENAPIQFSAADRLHRVALMQCSEPMTGIVGVCCRDPNYKDPWPDMKNNGQPQPVDKGQSQGQFQPPQGNHLPTGNPYSGARFTNSATQGNTGRSIKINPIPARYTNSQTSASSSANLLSESKQTLQVLETCASDELCLSMSQCNSLNPQFMKKTGFNFNAVQKRDVRENFTEPIKIKRCKYERSGIHYLCCKKPDSLITTTTRSSAFEATPAPTRFTSFSTSAFSSTSRPPTTTPPSIFTLPFSFPSTSFPLTSQTYSSTPSSLISGIGLRFHSGLHTIEQKKLDNKKPNPYGPNEQPIQLISPFETTPLSINPIRSLFTTLATSQPFRFTTTTTTNAPTSSFAGSNKFQSQTPFFTVSPSTTPTPIPISAFARIVGTSRAYISTTTGNFSNDTTSSTTRMPTESTTPESTTSTEGKVNIDRIPIRMTLSPEIKADPPIGFIWKGENLYIPELEMPSQNYLVPVNDFEPRVLPTDPPIESGEEVETTTLAATTSDSNNAAEEARDSFTSQSTTTPRSKSWIFNRNNPFFPNNSIEGTTIYSILDESSSHERRAG